VKDQEFEQSALCSNMGASFRVRGKRKTKKKVRDVVRTLLLQRISTRLFVTLLTQDGAVTTRNLKDADPFFTYIKKGMAASVV
jgi:hypothetical protein